MIRTRYAIWCTEINNVMERYEQYGPDTDIVLAGIQARALVDIAESLANLAAIEKRRERYKA